MIPYMVLGRIDIAPARLAIEFSHSLFELCADTIFNLRDFGFPPRERCTTHGTGIA